MKRTAKPRKPNLTPLPPRDELEIDMAAMVTPQDIEEAKAAARRYGSPRFVAILNAERASNGENET